MTGYPSHKQPGRVAFLSPRLNGIALIIAHRLSRRFLNTWVDSDMSQAADSRIYNL